MPASLLASQFETLEPLDADEHGVVIDVDQDIDSIVDTMSRILARNRTGELMNSGNHLPGGRPQARRTGRLRLAADPGVRSPASR